MGVRGAREAEPPGERRAPRRVLRPPGERGIEGLMSVDSEWGSGGPRAELAE